MLWLPHASKLLKFVRPAGETRGKLKNVCISGPRAARTPSGSKKGGKPILNDLQPIADRLHETIRAAIQNHAMLEVANNDKELIRLFNESYESHGFATIRNALTQTLLLQVTRCWDKHQADRASLPSLCERLSKPGITEALIEAAACWNPGMMLEEQNREAVRRHLEELQADVAARFQGPAKERLNRITEFRHIFVAHNLTKELAARPQYSDLFGLLDETIPLVWKANVAIQGRNNEYGDYRRIAEKQAKDFWASVRLGQKQTQDRLLQR